MVSSFWYCTVEFASTICICHSNRLLDFISQIYVYKVSVNYSIAMTRWAGGDMRIKSPWHKDPWWDSFCSSTFKCSCRSHLTRAWFVLIRSPMPLRWLTVYEGRWRVGRWPRKKIERKKLNCSIELVRIESSVICIQNLFFTGRL